VSLTTNTQTPTVANMKIVKQVLAIFLLRICQLQAEEKVSCETTAGNFTIDLHRQWAPLGHDRFVEVPLLCVRCFCVCVGGQEIYNHARNSVLGLTTVCAQILFNIQSFSICMLMCTPVMPACREPVLFRPDHLPHNTRLPGWCTYRKYIMWLLLYFRNFHNLNVIILLIHTLLYY
jgi:hypothetical protein